MWNWIYSITKLDRFNTSDECSSFNFNFKTFLLIEKYWLIGKLFTMTHLQISNTRSLQRLIIHVIYQSQRWKKIVLDFYTDSAANFRLGLFEAQWKERNLPNCLCFLLKVGLQCHQQTTLMVYKWMLFSLRCRWVWHIQSVVEIEKHPFV